MLTPLKRDGRCRGVLGRSIMGGVAVALLLGGSGGPMAGILAVRPALAQYYQHDDRNQGPDRDQDRDRDRDHHPPVYRPAPFYAPPAVIYAPPPPSPAIDFVFPINIR